MIRRSPTRIELKLEDLQEFDFIAKYDKKKAPASANDSKILRHERLGFRSKNVNAPTCGTTAGTNSRTLFQSELLPSGASAGNQRVEVTPTPETDGGEGADAAFRPPQSPTFPPQIPVVNLINIDESISSASYATPNGTGQDLMTMSIEEDIVRDED